MIYDLLHINVSIIQGGDIIKQEMIGSRFGRLIVVSKAQDKVSISGRVEKCWNCDCDCGNKNVIVRGSSLRNGNTLSCGCLRKELSSERRRKATLHGYAGTRIYKIWKMMIDRCENMSNKSYKNYGERGITVCTEWHDISEFVKWAINSGYREDLTIDRIDSSRGYSPANCRWADRITQNNNTSRNHFITYNGETKTLAQWSRAMGMSYSKLKSRINKYGWSVEKALTTP